MKCLLLFIRYILYTFCLFTFSTNANTKPLTLNDLSKFTEVKSYCELANISKIPLSVKIEQMLFLNWDLNNLNSKKLLSYLKQHHIGGISISVSDLAKNKNTLEQIIRDIKNIHTLPNFHTIPYFITINYNNLHKNLSEATNEENLKILCSLGANLIKINTNINCLEPLEEYNILFNYIRNSNAKGMIITLDEFKDPFFTNNEINIYGWLISKGKFNQIINPSSIDKNNNYTLDHKSLIDTIKSNLRFNGVILNTNLDCKNLVNKYDINQIIIKAITSGHNMLYYNGKTLENNKKFVNQVINIITTAINDNVISLNDINESYIKVINLKSQFCIIPRKNYC